MVVSFFVAFGSEWNAKVGERREGKGGRQGGCVCPQAHGGGASREQDVQTARTVASTHRFVTWTVTSLFSVKQGWPWWPPSEPAGVRKRDGNREES